MDELDKWEQWGNINRATGKHKMSGVTYFIYVYVYVYCIMYVHARTRVRVYESWMRRACVKRGRNTGNATYC